MLSVIMPVFNQDKDYLKQAIESILNQSYRDFEFLIIDDGSTDPECIQVLNTYKEQDSRIHLVQNPHNLGLIKSLNKGLSLAKGDYVARMDSDDISFPERFSEQMSFLLKNPHYTLIGSSAVIINESGKTIGFKKSQTSDFSVKNSLLLSNGFTHSAWIFQKDAVLNIGGYKEEAERVEDYDLLLRLSSNPKYKIVNLEKPLLYHRINNKGISWSNNRLQAKASIYLRWKLLKSGNFPAWQVILLLPSILLFMVPTAIKRLLILYVFKRNSTL